MVIKKLLITSIVFLIIGFFSLLPINLGILDPMGKALTDFDIYDLVFSKIRVEQNNDEHIVIVNIGNLNRTEIANQINELAKYKPRVIGLDAFFIEKKDWSDDSILAATISSVKNLVIINKLLDYNSSIGKYESILESNKIFQNASVGYANLPEDKKGSFRTIRTFKPKAYFKERVNYSFAVKIVESYNKTSFDHLLKRNNPIEHINFKGNINKFYFLDSYDINERSNLHFIKDKIVLLGYTGITLNTPTLEDIFFTPLNERYAGKTFPDMYGIVIHANIISMILNENYINEIPVFFNFILAIIFCYLNVITMLYIKQNLFDWFGGFSKLIILVQTCLLLFIGILLFNFFNFKIQLTLIMVVIVLVPTSIDFYNNYVEKFIKSIQHKTIGR
ncbi:MAG: CHASE2 domain-containing protein [Ignavibacteriales bacterium]|nr:CHASE2 domain-containing protein [Ignavibacteriales bacterium]